MAGDGCETNVTNNLSHCGFCGNACVGAGKPNTDVACQAPGTCVATCKGENYDVNNNFADGCEVSDSTVPGHTQAASSYLGTYSCTDSDSRVNFTGRIISDARVHTNPVVTSFNSGTGATPDYFNVYGDGGTFCEDDMDLTFTTTGGGSTPCYQLTVSTNKNTVQTSIISGSGSTSFGTGSGFYSDDTTLYFKIEKTCSSAVREVVTYSVSFHL
jgi:hypothetical protein